MRACSCGGAQPGEAEPGRGGGTDWTLERPLPGGAEAPRAPRVGVQMTPPDFWRIGFPKSQPAGAGAGQLPSGMEGMEEYL